MQPKILILLLFLLSFPGSRLLAAKEILHYRYGNQITQSTLSIFNDGTAVATEGNCCPPSNHATPFELSEHQWSGLLSAIENSRTAIVKSEMGAPTTMGSSSGELIVTPETGLPFVIRSINRSIVPQGKDTVCVNMAAQARWIEDFVLDHVREKMYLFTAAVNTVKSVQQVPRPR